MSMTLKDRIPKEFYSLFRTKNMDAYMQIVVALYEENNEVYASLGLTRDQIMVINEDHDGNLLVGTLQNGLYICDSKLNLLSHYFKNTTPFSLTDNNISAIHE